MQTWTAELYPGGDPSIPLFVDLDGTLLTRDCFALAFRSLIHSRPWVLGPIAMAWMRGGRPEAKALAAGLAPLEPAELPYRPSMLEVIHAQRQTGGKVILATASHEIVARPIADHVGLFDDVLATGPGLNLKGMNKRTEIERWCDERGYQSYAYAGDAFADTPIWEGSAVCLIISPSSLLRERLRQRGISEKALTIPA